jgi:hypothetical protein
MSQLQLMEVQDPGVPNLERIAIHVNEACDLGDYCLLIGHKNLDGSASPLQDSMFWFGRGWVSQGDWIFVYTAPGKTAVHDLEKPSRLISAHWGKDKTIFQNRTLVPMLCKIGETILPPEPEAKPQTLLSISQQY